jgi:hypothetical protein
LLPLVAYRGATRRVLYVAWSAPLPLAAKRGAFGRILFRVSLKHMKNENNQPATASGASQQKHGRKSESASQCRKDMHAARGLKLAESILKKLHEIEDSVGIIAAHMYRESSPKKTPDVKAE